MGRKGDGAFGGAVGIVSRYGDRGLVTERMRDVESVRTVAVSLDDRVPLLLLQVRQ